MLQGGEDLPLFDEAAHQMVVQRDPAPDQLEGDPLVVGLVALGEVHGAHATVPRLANDPVRTDAPAFGGLDVLRPAPPAAPRMPAPARRARLPAAHRRRGGAPRTRGASVLGAGLCSKSLTPIGRTLQGEIE